MPFYESGEVRIRYEEAGSGFPLLLLAGGGLNSGIRSWLNATPFNAIEEFKSDFRCIAMDQRNALTGESTGPLQVEDPWGMYASDQLGLLDHLGVREFMVLGCCIGGSFSMKLLEKAPDRVVAAVVSQTIGHRPENPDVMYNTGHETWGPALCEKRPDVTMEMVDAYCHNLFRNPADFIYSVSRDFVRSCPTPMLVMPDDTPAHSLEVSMEVARLAPNAELSMYPWKDPKELIPEAVEQVRAFLKKHEPVAATR
jgi:pimeloyl-ACP methyl ester carboxylesterase